jgi:phosphoglycerate-specific signal transduction histidine kinase
MSDLSQAVKAASKSETIDAFCEEISTPLEVVSTLLYTANHNAVSTEEARNCMQVAEARLAEVSGKVSSHCRER